MKDLLSMMRAFVSKSMQFKFDPALKEIDLAKILKDGSLPVSGYDDDSEENANCERWQDKVIENEIREGSSVLDLGCGTGELLERLVKHKKVFGQGIEIDEKSVASCVERGVAVFQADLDEGLKGFPDGSFDYVILEETLPTLKQPMRVLTDMLRVGSRGIVSFPNFGYWKIRLALLIEGRMPITERLSAPWFNTENIRLFTLRDLFDWAQNEGVIFEKSFVLNGKSFSHLSDRDNLLAEEVLVVLKKNNITNLEKEKK